MLSNLSKSLNIRTRGCFTYNLGMLFLILALLSGPAHAKSEFDTCAMADNSLHTLTGSFLVHHGYRGTSLKKRTAIERGKTTEATKEFISQRDQVNFVKKSIEVNKFANESKLFTVYRNYIEDNPCTNMKEKLKKEISWAQKEILKQCSNSSGSNKKIKVGKKIEWSSQYFVEKGVFMDVKCEPQINSGELYSMHQLTNGFKASVEQLCHAAWSGLKEVWSKIESCQWRGGWYDIKEWSKGNIVKRPPPKGGGR
jgi:hypothetical protein